MKEKKYLVLSTIILIVLLVFGVSYSFYKARIEGDTKSISLKTKGIYLLYKGDLNLVSGYIEPGWSVTKTFTIENQGSEIEKYNIYIKDLVNTFVTEGYLQYKITSSNGYNMSEYKDIPKAESKTDTVLAYSVAINPKEEQEYTIELIYKDTEEDQSEDMGKILSGTLNIQEGTTNSVPLLTAMLRDNPTRRTRSNDNNGTNDFATPFTETTTGILFTSTESITGITDGPQEVYYYAGNTTNNWVKFAGFYWRIIRTNHDGSIRLLYVGTSHSTTNGYIGYSEFNTDYYTPKYIGYKYGEDTSLDTIRTNTNDSTVKTHIDTWYKNNLTNYTKYLSTSAVYCNDRSEGNGQIYNYASSPSSSFKFASYYRMDYDASGAKANPTYNCSDIRDAFSVDNTSAQLSYPIALMTADEIAFAGGVAYKEMSTPYAWFISNSVGTQVSNSWWSLSPLVWYNSNAFEWRWNSTNAYLNRYSVGTRNTVRPVISLKSCTLYGTGDGTSENPYTILETNSGC